MTPAQEAKLDKIHETVQDIKLDYARMVFHQEQHRKELTEMKAKVDKHENTQTMAYTFFGLAGVGLTAFWSWLFKH
jgi:hypothetical protein